MKKIIVLVLGFILAFSLNSFAASQSVSGSQTHWQSDYVATCNVSATGYYDDTGPSYNWKWIGCSSVNVSASVSMNSGYYLDHYNLSNEWGDHYYSDSNQVLHIEGGGRLKVYYGERLFEVTEISLINIDASASSRIDIY